MCFPRCMCFRPYYVFLYTSFRISALPFLVVLFLFKFFFSFSLYARSAWFSFIPIKNNISYCIPAIIQPG